MVREEDVLEMSEVKYFKERFEEIKEEVSRVIVGQERVVESLFTALISNGHVLVEGVPGIAKTLLIRSLARATGCMFKRIQFTVDLLPSDILGIVSYTKEKGFHVEKGPIFANFVLADEINRAPPKTQSALLEAMGERQVTIGNQTFPLPNPFFVMATQNPIEQAGTYPLPEAQVDRFLMKVNMGYPSFGDEKKILDQNIAIKRFEEYGIKPILMPEHIIKLQEMVKKVYVDESIKDYIVKLVTATREWKRYKIRLGRYIAYGSSPRGSIFLYIASKARAVLTGKNYVDPEAVRTVVKDVLRHRLILNYEGLAEGVTTDAIIDEVIKKVPLP